jgi:guanylate kinase
MISGPTGSGKQTLINKLRERRPEINFTVSCTTRPKRPYEIDGTHYHFISEDTFKDYAARGLFIEQGMPHGYHYGTLRSAILPDHFNITDIDVEGVTQVKELARTDPSIKAVNVFVTTADFETLRRRIVDRDPTIAPEVIERRLETARTEIVLGPKLADKIIYNEDGKLDEALDELERFLFPE